MRGHFLRRAAIGLAIAAVAILAYGWAESRRMPVVRQITLPLPSRDAPVRALRIVFLTDIHVVDLGFSRRRLARIVQQVNALRPDLVLIGGDLVGGAVQTGQIPVDQALAPLSALRSTFGTVAVLGNHDHWSSPPAIRDVLRRGGATMLQNEAVRRGRLVIGGVDDDFTGHADVPRTLDAMKALGGPGLILTHGPDVFPEVPPAGALVLTGHTHCGQIVLPVLGAPFVPSRYGRRYVCGLYREPGRTLIVSGGTGYSKIPIRFGAPPEMWVIDLVPGAKAGR